MSSSQLALPPDDQFQGYISIVSKSGSPPYHNPSLIHNIWEYEHDPEDQELRNIFKHKTIKSTHKNVRPSPPRRHKLAQKGETLHRHHSQIQIHRPEDNAIPGIYFKRSEYGLLDLNHIEQQENSRHPTGAKKSSKSRSISNHSKSYRRKSQLLRPKKDSPRPSQIISDDELEEVRRSDHQFPQKQPIALPLHHIHSQTRQIDIYSHKQLSNINLMIRQTKQLLLLNRMNQLQYQVEQYRKRVIKKEIQCRKLKIGLRNSSSNANLLRAKNEKSNNKQQNINLCNRHKTKGKQFAKVSPLKSNNRNIQQRQDYLATQIAKAKKRNIELAAKEVSVKNYYNVLKNKTKSLEEACDGLDVSAARGTTQQLYAPILISTSKKMSQFSSQLSTAGSYRNYAEILTKKKTILINSLEETTTYVDKKLQIASQEIQLLSKQLAMIQQLIQSGSQSKFSPTNDNQQPNKISPDPSTRNRTEPNQLLEKDNKTSKNLYFNKKVYTSPRQPITKKIDTRHRKINDNSQQSHNTVRSTSKKSINQLNGFHKSNTNLRGVAQSKSNRRLVFMSPTAKETSIRVADRNVTESMEEVDGLQETSKIHQSSIDPIPNNRQCPLGSNGHQVLRRSRTSNIQPQQQQLHIQNKPSQSQSDEPNFQTQPDPYRDISPIPARRSDLISQSNTAAFNNNNTQLSNRSIQLDERSWRNDDHQNQQDIFLGRFD